MSDRNGLPGRMDKNCSSGFFTFFQNFLYYIPEESAYLCIYSSLQPAAKEGIYFSVT